MEDTKRPPLDGTFGEESRETGTRDNLNERLRRYESLHTRALDMADYIHRHPNGKSKQKSVFKLRQCGNFLLFRDYYTVDQIRLHKASFCKKTLLCPLCGARKAVKMVNAYSEKHEEIKRLYPGIKAYLVTFTAKNCSDLHEMFNHVSESMRKMTYWKRQAKAGNRPEIEMNKALAGVSVIEVKIGKNSGLWHVHIHCIWLCYEKPWETKLSAEWKEATGDSYIVDVREIDEDEKKYEAFLETFGYTLKFSTMSLEDNYKAFSILQKRRFINSFGLFRGIQIPEDLTDDPLENVPYVELLFKFIKESGYNYIPTKKEVKK